MKHRITRMFLILALGSALPACAGLTFYYTAKPITATVIDAETKQPLEGVIVTANWELDGGIFGDYPVGQLAVMEAVTDKDGKFHFPGWGPRLAIRSHLSPINDPQLILFKPGYDYLRLTNWTDVGFGFNKGSRRGSKWDGKVVGMKRFKGNSQGTYLGWNFEVDLNFLLETDAWKQTPCAVLALNAEAKRVGLKSILNFFPVSGRKGRDEISKFLTGTGQCKKP
ncbi:MAG: peptidase associated/transthyretin-like domain-containing protein [Acidiferrobacterales bacterium]